DKDALAADLRKGGGLQLVAGSLDNDDFGFDTGVLKQLLADELRLPFGEQAATRADAKVLHDFSRLERNRSRRASTFCSLRRNSRSPRRRSAGSTNSLSRSSSMRTSM